MVNNTKKAQFPVAFGPEVLNNDDDDTGSKFPIRSKRFIHLLCKLTSSRDAQLEGESPRTLFEFQSSFCICLRKRKMFCWLMHGPSLPTFIVLLCLIHSILFASFFATLTHHINNIRSSDSSWAKLQNVCVRLLHHLIIFFRFLFLENSLPPKSHIVFLYHQAYNVIREVHVLCGMSLKILPSDDDDDDDVAGSGGCRNWKNASILSSKFLVFNQNE